MRPFVLLLVLTLLPVASASASLEGSVRADPPLSLEGPLEATTDAGVLDLGPDVVAGSAPRISWERATGYEMDAQTHTSALPADTGATTRDGGSKQPISWGAGSLRADACASPCILLLLVNASAPGTLGLQGEAHGDLGLTREENVFTTVQGGRPDGEDSSLGLVIPSESLVATAGAPLRDARPTASGSAILLVCDVQGNLTTGGQTQRLDTTRQREPDSPEGLPLPVATGETDHVRYMYLTLDGVRIDAPAGSAARLLAPSLDLHLDGNLVASGAHGEVRTGGPARDLAHDTLLVEGDLRVAARSLALSDAGAPAPLEAPHGLGLDLGGRADLVVAGGLVVEDAHLVPPVPRDALAALAVALLALAELTRRGALGWGLYARVGRADALQNENRSALLALIRAQPGLHVTALATASGQSEVVVRHHLRVLERTGWIRVQRDDRARRAFAVEQPQAMAAQAARQAAGSGGRARIARALCGTPGEVTQRDLAAATALPQRLVSYHLLRLESAGLVGRRPGKPQRYAATPRLRDALRDRA